MLYYRKKQYDEKLEFRTIINEFIFPYLGILETDLQYIISDKFEIKNYYYFFKNKLYFFPNLNSNYGYFIPVYHEYKNQEFDIINNLIKELMEVSYNNNKDKYNSLDEVFRAYQKVLSHISCSYLYPTNPSLLFNVSAFLVQEAAKYKHPVFSIIIDNERQGNELTYKDIINQDSFLINGEDRKEVAYIDSTGHFIEHCTLNFEDIQNKDVLKKVGLILTANNDLFVTRDGKVVLLCKNRVISGFCLEDFILTIKSNKKTSKLDISLLNYLFYLLFDTMIDSNGKYICVLNEELESSTPYHISDYFNDYKVHKIVENSDEVVIDNKGKIISLKKEDYNPLLVLRTIKDGRLEIYVDNRLLYNLFKEIVPSK